jgi:hypothetical protein
MALALRSSRRLGRAAAGIRLTAVLFREFALAGLGGLQDRRAIGNPCEEPSWPSAGRPPQNYLCTCRNDHSNKMSVPLLTVAVMVAHLKEATHVLGM